MTDQVNNHKFTDNLLSPSSSSSSISSSSTGSKKFNSLQSPKPVDVKYSASRVTKYQPCTIDLRPARVVHYPDLNACLVNERSSSVNNHQHHNHQDSDKFNSTLHNSGASNNVDCRAVHFGYAIPISVLPLEKSPELAELVLDTGSDLTPEATNYLLQHHPQFRDMASVQGVQNKQRTSPSANPQHPSASAPGPGVCASAPDDDDIAAIAKQISDHAEAIYQTWKSRGLGPAELRNICQPSSAAHTFAPVLTPSPKSKPEPISPKPVLTKVTAPKTFTKHNDVASQHNQPSSPTSVGLLNTSQLEYLVSSFVEEDKARIAAKGNKSPSLIQSTVKKFDQQATSPSNINPLNKVIAPKKSTSIINSFSQENNVSGLTTWPLKNHLKDISNKSKPQLQTIPQNIPVQNNELPLQYSPAPQLQQAPVVAPVSSPTKYATLPAKKNATSAAVFLEEVAREEERLINALKTGCVIEDFEHSPSPLSPLTLKKSSPKLSDDKISGLSRIDYAKVRYQAAQENPLTRQRLEDARELDHCKDSLQAAHNSQSTVSEARNRFETTNCVNNSVTDSAWKSSEWVPSKFAVDDTGALTPTPPLETIPIAPVSRLRNKISRKSRGELEVPHPELTVQQKQHIKERGSAAAAAGGLASAASGSGLNPIRPFLTRGSVAERVLIFEKCPPSEVLNPLLEKRKAPPVITTWRSGNEVHSKTQLWNLLSVVAENGPRMTYSSRDRDVNGSARSSPGHTPTLRSPASHASIPRFHFPRGRPTPQHETEAAHHAVIALFNTFPGHAAVRENFADVAKACGLPVYWKLPLFLASGGDVATGGFVSLQTFLELWTKLIAGGNDETSRMVWLLTRGQRSWLAPEDLVPLVQDVVDTHPGLSFLKEANEFHSRYVHTVIARMFYCANRSWSGRLTIPEIRRSQIVSAVRQLEVTADINQVTQFFSYEHFYVIYCKFWELDRDHDLYIDRNDLARHNDHALSSRMIDRIFSGAVTRGRRGVKKGEERMSYTEFVWFLLSEEDKTHPTAIEYWFRCMDLDGDGFLSMYELEYFYEEQLQRMEAIGMETLPFEDCLCQMLDMIRPEVHGKISLRDLKHCKLSPLFFDTFFNLEKFLDHEQRDPFATQPRETAPDGTELSDWDRYAAEEYELLVAEESGAEPPDDMMLYDELSDEDEDDGEDLLSPNLDRLEEFRADRKREPGNDDTWGNLGASLEADEDSGDYAGDSDDYSF